MWLFPALTLGLVSVLIFCSGAMVGLAAWTAPGVGLVDVLYPGFLMLVGSAGMWLTVRMTH